MNGNKTYIILNLKMFNGRLSILWKLYNDYLMAGWQLPNFFEKNLLLYNKKTVLLGVYFKRLLKSINYNTTCTA